MRAMQAKLTGKQGIALLVVLLLSACTTAGFDS
jgi:hypothetical protein